MAKSKKNPQDRLSEHEAVISNVEWSTQKRFIRELTPHPKNPRFLSVEGHKNLKKSLIKYNYAELATANLDNMILAGHQRILIMQELGWGEREIEIRIPSRLLTEEEADNYLLLSNKATGDWDYDIMANQWELTDLIAGGFNEKELYNEYGNMNFGEVDAEEQPDLTKTKKKYAQNVVMNFRLAYTTHEAAKYAVENWHYSRCLPFGGLIKIGVWEDNKFIGCIIYSNGACPSIGNPFNLNKSEVCELTRIALNKHKNPVSRFLGYSIKMIQKKMPNLKILISFADPDQGHYGGIYQATNWIYLGITKPAEHFINDKGFKIHSKTLKTGKKGLATKLLNDGKIKQIFCFKHKYIYPLTKELKELYKLKSKPYPMRYSYNIDNTAVNHAENGVQNHRSALLN